MCLKNYETEVRNIVHKAVSKPIPKEKKSKKVKWSFEEAIQTAEERRETKYKGEKESYIQLNSEFQRIARRGKKAFFNEQCQEIEENIRRGNIRDFFKKTGDIRGKFHAKMGTINDRNGKDLVKTEQVKTARLHRRTVPQRS